LSRESETGEMEGDFGLMGRKDTVTVD